MSIDTSHDFLFLFFLRRHVRRDCRSVVIFNSLLLQAYESPLAVVAAAGCTALPALLKMSAVVERSGQQLAALPTLPAEVELGPEFVFHSIFACPVSREAATPDNPAMLLPCGHMLCEQSVARIAKGRSKILKCPYCPTEARADNLRALTFPDVGSS